MNIHKLPKELIERQIDIAIAGAGGNGSQVVNGLARMHLALKGVGHPGLRVTLWDPDTITPANIGRQLFSPSDVGQNKARVLIHRINLYYGLQWSAEACLYHERNSEPDILIGCVDSVAARRQLGKSCSATYWLDLGNADRSGQVILGQFPRKDNKLDVHRPLTVLEMFPELTRGRPKEDNAPSCSLAAALERQDLFINQSLATFALQLLWSFIRHGETTIQGYFINLATGHVRPIPVPHHRIGKTLAETFAEAA